jgi:hypothetical protein
VRTVHLTDAADEGVLHIAAKGASCDDVSGPDAHAACHIHQQDWGIPIIVDPQGQSRVALTLSG